MIVSLAYRFRLIPNKNQEKSFFQYAGACRFLYNLALEQKNLIWVAHKKNISYADQCKELTLLKKENDWLKLIPAQCLQQALKDLDRAFINFFKNLAKFPIFKKKGLKDSFRFPDPKQFSVKSISANKAIVELPKIGKVKFFQSREIEGTIKQATIIRDGLHWYISFTCEKELKIIQNEGKPIGVDRGIIRTIALSNEENYEEDELKLPVQKIKKIELKISHLQWLKRNQVKFSKGWKKTKKKIVKLYKKITNIRHDFLHKISSKLAKNHSFITLEDLKVKNMSSSASGTLEDPGKNVKAKSGLNRSILRQGWFKFQCFLNYKTAWYGSYLQLIPAHYTSQTCSQCGYVDAGNRKTQELFLCLNEKCRHSENADTNSAKVILTLGLRGRARGVTT